MKAAREILVLNRYEVKQDCLEKGLHKGDVVLHIRNDQGVEYYTTLRRNKAHSCNCAARKVCYHISHCQTLENNRWYKARMAKVHAQEAAKIDAVVEATKAYVKEQDVKTVAQPAKITDISTRGNLNGQSGFSILRKVG
jgi:hypothetical protein